MSEQKPIPVRLSEEVIARLDVVAAQMGSTRAGLIRLCTKTFLDHLEEAGLQGLPLNWRDILAQADGRRMSDVAMAAETTHPAVVPTVPPKKVDYRDQVKEAKKRAREKKKGGCY